jgi:hypothetical protein
LARPLARPPARTASCVLTTLDFVRDFAPAARPDRNDKTATTATATNYVLVGWLVGSKHVFGTMAVADGAPLAPRYSSAMRYWHSPDGKCVRCVIAYRFLDRPPNSAPPSSIAPHGPYDVLFVTMMPGAHGHMDCRCPNARPTKPWQRPRLGPRTTLETQWDRPLAVGVLTSNPYLEIAETAS